MKVNKFLIILFFTSFFLLYSCATGNEAVKEDPVLEQEEVPVIRAEPKEPVTVVTKEAPAPATLEGTELEKAETDIAELIDKLNGLVSARNFKAWKEYLSDEYISYYSNPDILAEMSKSPLLLKNKIVLRSLMDYFNYIVVGSRQKVKLDDIKVLDRDHIKAYMFINNNPVIIYELERIDENWKIGKFLE
ncbi:MAG: hypothetical protein L3J12_09460 [Spirochaetales bacterium]|nr:hypothetical protein [Spirochaetales bacterium]